MGQKTKEGYAYRKAIELIAYERGSRKSPVKMPQSRALRGAVQTWKGKLLKGGKYVPSTGKMGKIIKAKIKTEGLYIRERVGVVVTIFTIDAETLEERKQEYNYAGSINQTIPETLISITDSWLNKEKIKSVGDEPEDNEKDSKKKAYKKLTDVLDSDSEDCYLDIMTMVFEFCNDNVVKKKWDFEFWNETIQIEIDEGDFDCYISFKMSPINRIKVLL